MRLFSLRAGVGVVQALVLCAGGVAFAGGGSSADTSGTVVARATYRCQGGVRVQITQMPDTARVEFAGQSQLLKLVQAPSGDRYQNNTFTWFTKGDTSYMKRNASGRLALTGCTPVGG